MGKFRVDELCGFWALTELALGFMAHRGFFLGLNRIGPWALGLNLIGLKFLMRTRLTHWLAFGPSKKWEKGFLKEIEDLGLVWPGPNLWTV